MILQRLNWAGVRIETIKIVFLLILYIRARM